MAQIVLSAVGDISLGDHPVCAGHGVRSRSVTPTFRAGIPIVRELLGVSDIGIGNVEAIISDVGLAEKLLESVEMRGHGSSICILKELGLNVLCVANNHMMQHGHEAFSDMVKAAYQQGLDVAGLDDDTGNSVPFFFGLGDTRCAIVAYSTRPEQWTTEKTPYSLRRDPARILEEIKRLRATVNGHIIVSIHWGLEFLDLPSKSQVAFARSMVDAGASVIIGHHSHTLQPVEQYRDALIFYSLGNFIFDLWQRELRLGGIVRITLSDCGPSSYELVPIAISKQFLPELVDDDELRSILRSLQVGSDCIRTGRGMMSDEEQELAYRAKCRQFRHSSYRYFIANLARYPLWVLWQSLYRTFFRRLRGE